MDHKASVALLVVACLFIGPPTARAERPAEDREAADYHVTAKVEKVFQRTEGRLQEYVVLLKVREVHKGENIEAGDELYAYCFKKRQAPIPVPEASGHDAVPKEGQLIKAYVRKRKGRNEGNYKDWFDVMEDNKDKAAPKD